MSNNQKNKQVSRREFLEKTGKTALLGGAAVTLGGGFLVGCDNQEVTNVSDNNSSVTTTLRDGTYEWEYAPEPIPEDQIKSVEEAEIVIIGAGAAGCCAALTAAEEGVNTVVLQKHSGVLTNGAGVGTYNSKAAQEAGVEMDLNEFINMWSYMSDNRTDAKMLKEVWAKHSGPTLDWLFEQTADSDEVEVIFRPGNMPPAEYLSTLNEMKAKAFPIPALFNSMMSVAKVLATKAAAMGVDFRWNTPAERLLREDGGRVTGVIAQKENGDYIQINASKGVVLCAGDYANNTEMRSKWLQHVKDLPSPYKPQVNTGDGFKMAMWIGAAIDDGPHTSNVHTDTYFTDTDHAYAGGAPWLWVNNKGDRFCNEDCAYIHVYAQTLNQPGHEHFQIFDAASEQYVPGFMPGGDFRGQLIEISSPAWAAVCAQNGIDTSNMSHWEICTEGGVAKGHIVKANTLDELASELGIEAKAFKATVSRYNELADNGNDEDFGKHASRVTPIKTAPFYGVRRVPMPLGVLSGVTINTDLQVLDTEGVVIPGLYAAGNNSGGNWFAGLVQPMCGPGMTLGRATTTGRLAVKNIIASI